MEERIHYLYRHIRHDKNEPFYIGIGTVLKRNTNTKSVYTFYERANKKEGRSKYWNNIVSKTEYDIEILFESSNYEFIKSKEIEFINLYGRKDLKLGSLVNLTDGAEGGLNPSEETRIKRSESQKGIKHHNYGGKASKDTRIKLSNVRLGEKNHFYGKKHSSIAKLLMSNKSTSKKVIDIDSLIIYNSVGLAANSCGYKQTTLSKYLNKEVKNKTNLIFLSEYLEQNPDFKWEE